MRVYSIDNYFRSPCCYYTVRFSDNYDEIPTGKRSINAFMVRYEEKWAQCCNPSCKQICIPFI